MSLPVDPSAAAYVDQAAALLGVPLTAEHRSGVVAQMAILSGIAGPLLEFALPAEIEPAPVYEP